MATNYTIACLHDHLTVRKQTTAVCRITFETWADTLSGHDSLHELSGYCVEIMGLNQ